MSKELELLKEAVRLLEEKESKDECEIANRFTLASLKPGETFKIGEHDFIVLEHIVALNQTMVISKGFMAEDKVFDNDCRDYNKSSLKKLIESDIQPIIEKEVGSDNVVEHEVDLTSVDMQNEFEKCKCKVRPITFDEVRKYNDLLVNKDLDYWWWTCTPWSTVERGFKYSMAVVSPSCNFDYFNYINDYGVRPFCILKSNIFVSKGE